MRDPMRDSMRDPMRDSMRDATSCLPLRIPLLSRCPRAAPMVCRYAGTVRIRTRSPSPLPNDTPAAHQTTPRLQLLHNRSNTPRVESLSPQRAAGADPVALRDLTPAEARRLGTAGMRTFLAIADEWQLTVPARRILLGELPESTYHKWKLGDVGTPSRDQLERLSLLLGIYKAIRLLFSDDATGIRWLRAVNAAPDFASQTPLERMGRGSIDDLWAVRRYLDGWRGSWP